MRKYRNFGKFEFARPRELLEAHFSTWSYPEHVNYEGFLLALDHMGGLPRNIFETGTSAWGVDSTRLWDAYVHCFGGQLWSVDVSPEPRERLLRQVGSRTRLIVSDSVTAMKSFAEICPGIDIDVCYLDSWDLDWGDPEPAALHGLAEWKAIQGVLSPSALLVVDDSPASLAWIPAQFQEAAQDFQSVHGFLPGKGALIHQELANSPRAKVLWHGYNVVYALSQ